MKLTNVTVDFAIAGLASLPFLAAAVGACAGANQNLRVEISMPELVAHSSGKGTVSVQISSEDLRRIADEEIYAGIVVTSCDDEKQRYPVETYAEAVSLDNFRDLRAVIQQAGENKLKIRGTISQNFLSRVANRCIELEGGGSYGGISVKSNVLSIEL
jgi:hypothetical protein